MYCHVVSVALAFPADCAGTSDESCLYEQRQIGAPTKMQIPLELQNGYCHRVDLVYRLKGGIFCLEDIEYQEGRRVVPVQENWDACAFSSIWVACSFRAP